MTRKEEIKQASEEYYNKVKYLSDLSATPINAFKVGAEWADKTMIDKACEWLESVNLDYYQIREGIFSRELVDDFRKAMEE